MKILIFTEGTILMPKLARGLSREQRVELSKSNDPLVSDFKNYVPIDNPQRQILNWKKLGAEIYYLTSRTKLEEIEDIHFILKKYDFPDNQNLLFRKNGEEYKDVVENLMPDVLIEDDCESIGGKIEMTYPQIKTVLKPKIKSIVIKEFAGIDQLQNIFMGQ